MSFDLVKVTVSTKRHIPTPFGNKDSFYSESLEVPSELAIDRSSVYSFLTQRLDLSFLLDYYYSVSMQDGSTPNTEVWPFVVSRVQSMKVMHDTFPDEIKSILAFNADLYLSRKR